MNNNNHCPRHYKINPPGEYFLTSRTIHGLSIMQTDIHKHVFLDIFWNKCLEFELEPVAWFVTDNHYHCIVYSDSYFNLSRFVNRIHSVTAGIFNRMDRTPGRQVWYQYWDRIIRTEKESWQFFNYVHFNAIKHGLVISFIDLNKYIFCSWNIWNIVLGKEVVEIFFESYPLDDFKPFDR